MSFRGGRWAGTSPPDRAVSRWNAGVEWRRKQKSDVAPSCWGDVRAARVIGLPGVHIAPRCSVSASTREDRVLRQTRGAEPHCGMLSVGARCCSCWERQPGGRTFSADTTLACQRSLPEFYSAILPTTRARAIGSTFRAGLSPKPSGERRGPHFRSPRCGTGECGEVTGHISSAGVHVGVVVSARRFRSPPGSETGAPT